MDLEGLCLKHFVHEFSAVHVNIQENNSRIQDNIFLGTLKHLLKYFAGLFLP